MEPRQATRCTRAQWDGQDVALSVNSPPCLLLKVFLKYSSDCFMLALDDIALHVYMLPMSSEAAVFTSHWGMLCSAPPRRPIVP